MRSKIVIISIENTEPSIAKGIPSLNYFEDEADCGLLKASNDIYSLMGGTNNNSPNGVMKESIDEIQQSMKSQQQEMFNTAEWTAFPFSPDDQARPSDALFQMPWDGKESGDGEEEKVVRRTHRSRKKVDQEDILDHDIDDMDININDF